jgi:hypothetical protein
LSERVAKIVLKVQVSIVYPASLKFTYLFKEVGYMDYPFHPTLLQQTVEGRVID